MNDLVGKVALITGASTGIGAATAIVFARLGAKLSLTGRNEANLKRTSDECVHVQPAKTEQPLMVRADVTSEADVNKLVDATIKKFGRLHILVNNAGINERGSIESTSLEQYDRIMNVNVRSVYHLTMLCVPYLIKTRGNIVNVSSIAGSRSLSNEIAYSVSKSALDQLTSCAALDLASKGVRVNSVNPGFIFTDIHTRGGMSDEEYAKFIEKIKGGVHPLRRGGDPEEVAQAIAFLAADKASFITGEYLHVDGGWHATTSAG